MDFTALLVFLGLIGTVWNNPITTPSTCDDGCTPTKHNMSHHLDFKHSPDLQETSVAPWTLEDDEQDGREPRFIQNAKCSECTVAGMAAEPITIQISVYRMLTNEAHTRWCKCPYTLAVGCTCVRS